VRQYLRAYFFPGTPDGGVDRAAIDAALPKMAQHFSVLDRAVAKTGHLVGNTFTLADINLLPILFYYEQDAGEQCNVAAKRKFEGVFRPPHRAAECQGGSPAAVSGPPRLNREKAMRYMFLIYSRETDMDEMSAAERAQLRATHWALIDETRAKGIFQGAEPLHPTATATSVRIEIRPIAQLPAR
jgi:hypothetical protein